MVCKKIQKACPLLKVCKKQYSTGECHFIYHWEAIKDKKTDSDFAKQIKKEMYSPFIEKWEDFAKDPKSGKKRMTGGVFEKALRDSLRKELSPLGAVISNTGVKLTDFESICGNVDCLIEKEERPKSIISVKTWLGTEQLRETFATAYFAKYYYGQLNIRVYMVAFLPFNRKTEWEKACLPYVDGIFGMAWENEDKKPRLIEELLIELRKTYS